MYCNRDTWLQNWILWSDPEFMKTQLYTCIHLNYHVIGKSCHNAWIWFSGELHFSSLAAEEKVSLNMLWLQFCEQEDWIYEFRLIPMGNLESLILTEITLQSHINRDSCPNPDRKHRVKEYHHFLRKTHYKTSDKAGN